MQISLTSIQEVKGWFNTGAHLLYLWCGLFTRFIREATEIYVSWYKQVAIHDSLFLIKSAKPHYHYLE